MEYQSVNIRKLILAKLGNITNKLFGNIYSQDTHIQGYKLIKDITPSYTNKKNRVSIYQNAKGNKVVAKRVIYRTENMDSTYLRNEAYILYKISKIKLGEKTSPEFISFINKKNESVLLTNYFEGMGLDKFDKKTRIKNILKALALLSELSNKMKISNFDELPNRNPRLYLLSFPLNLIRVIMKNPKKAPIFLKLTFTFYRNYKQVLFGKFSFGLVHRDLYPDNILYSKKDKSIRIIDWESTTVSDNLYDLAQIAMIYSHELSHLDLMELLGKYLKNTSQKRRFVGLSIFNGIQILAYHKPNEQVYQDTENFISYLTSDIYQSLIYKKSPFEIINSATLNFIYFFYKVTKLPNYSTNKKLVLCYHSIGNFDWRYTVKPNNFRKQIEFLNKHYKIKTISNLLSENKGGITITFDDGYSDVVDNALPLLVKKKIFPTMFIIGNYKHANRKELDNNLEIINHEEVKKLHNQGWEIGYHTTTHANLGTINEQDLENEIVKGKIDLEKKLGFPIKYFAYPKGIYTDEIIKYVKKANYIAAFTTDGYPVRKDSDSAKISRISIEKELTISQLEALLSPLGLYISGVFVGILKFKAKYF